MLLKKYKILLFIFMTILSYFLIRKLFYIPIQDYGLFESGMYNILNNYLFLLCLLGLLLLLNNTNNIAYYIYFLTVLLLIYISTLIFIDVILELIFLHNLDLLWGFDKFPLVILYFLSIFLGIILWFNPISNLFKTLSIIIFSFAISFHIALKDIEIFTLKSFINFPGGNLIIIIWLSVILIYLLKTIKKNYIQSVSKIYGSWLIVIGIMSSIFSLLY